MENYLDEAQVLVDFIKSKLTELEALGSDDVVPDHGGAGTLCRGDNDRPDDWDAPDDGDDPNMQNDSNLDRMLGNSVKPATLAQYNRAWDKWADFASYYDLEVMPPEVRGLEIFLADLAELTGSSGVTLMTAAAVTHFCVLEWFDSSFTFPRFGKIMCGIKASYGKAAKPKRPFTTDDIVKFMRKARSGQLKDWRAALPLALCFQQLLRDAECFDLNESNVSINDGYLGVVVETSKNHPEGFRFRVRVDRRGLAASGCSCSTTSSSWRSG
jgi:hypothetical protein